MACFHALQVEDDEHDVYFLNYACREVALEDYLRVVRSGEEALEYFEGIGRFSNREEYPIPGMVLLDLKLPKMNGLEVLRWIRAQDRFHAVIVIVFSASAHPDDIEKASFLGANAYVQKPSGTEELVEFIRSVKGFWGRYHVFPPAFSELVRQPSAMTALKPEPRGAPHR